MLLQSPIHLAVWRPQYLSTLIEAGYDVNEQDWNGRTPLMYAAAVGAVEVAMSLVQAGADLWARDILYSSQNWMEYAIWSNHWSLVLSVVDAIRQSPLFSSTEIKTVLNDALKLWAKARSKSKGHSEHFEALLKWGADPEIRFTAQWPLHREANNSLLHCISTPSEFHALVNSGFTSFNHVNSGGLNPLTTLLENANPELIRLCVSLGCNVDHQDKRDRTALHVCAALIRDYSFHPGNGARAS